MEDAATIAYRAALPRVLAPLVPFSSAAALSAPKCAPATRSRASSCAKCRTEIIGGLNGTVWLEGGAAWARCDGCGWATKRTGDGNGNGDSKARFAPVKRRRKDAGAGGKLSVPPGRAVEAALPPPPPPPSSTVLETSKRLLPAASAKGLRAGTLSTPAVITPRHPSSIPGPTPLSKPAPAPAPVPTPASSKSGPTTDLTARASAQKRKRAKQPSGLAEMLEAKRRSAKAATPTLGLQDFLQGM